MLLGKKFTDGIIFSVIIYGLLISMGFVFILPILNMLSASFKGIEELLDPTVGYIPRNITFENYQKALQVLNFKQVIWQSLLVTVVPSILQSLSCAIVGYGFARFDFAFKKMLFAFTLITFIIPAQITLIPQYLTFQSFDMLGNLSALAVPALLGQGLRSAIFILLFYQFFKMLPKSLEEAARLDGASDFKVFLKVAMPTVTPALIVTFIFSLVWYWNETYTTKLFLAGNLSTLPLELSTFTASFQQMFKSAGEDAQRINQGIQMAATILTILPMMCIYFVLQRWFVEGVDRSGITGE